MKEYRIRLIETAGKKIYLRCQSPSSAIDGAEAADDTEEREGIYLYPSEIRKSGLKDGMVLTDDQLEELRLTYALPRAKKRALGSLVKRDKTMRELSDKLKDSLNDSASIREALDYVRIQGYADDRQYAADYLRSRRKSRSFRVIRMELQRKGIPSDMLDLLFEEEEQTREDVEEAVRKYVRKFSGQDPLSRKKICAHFFRKGYEPGLIHDILADDEFFLD